MYKYGTYCNLTVLFEGEKAWRKMYNQYFLYICDICCIYVLRPYGDGCAALCVTLRRVTLT